MNGRNANKKEKTTKITLLFLLLCNTLVAQIPTAADPLSKDNLIIAFQQRFDAMDSLISGVFHTSNPSILQQWDYSAPEGVESIKQSIQAQTDLFKSQNGLDLSGHLYARPLGKMGYDSDDPSAAYTAKAQLELRWNIFQSSLMNRANNIRELQLQGELEQLEFEKQAMSRLIFDYKLNIEREFNSSLLFLLNYHSDNIHLITQTEAFLLKQGSIASDDILKNMEKQVDIDRQINAIKSHDIFDTPSCLPIILTVNIDSATLVNSILNSYLDIKALNLEMEIADCRTNSIKWFEQASLYPFVRYSWYARTTSGSMNNLDAGIGFSIPLSTETTNRRRAANAKKAVLEYRKTQAIEQIMFEVNTIIKDIKLCNSYIQSEQEHLNELRQYLADRNDSYVNGSGDYNRLHRLEEYNALLSSWEKLLENGYKRDLKLADLQSYVTNVSISQYIEYIIP